MTVDNKQSPEVFWDDLYRSRTKPTDKNPSAVLKRFASDRVPGTALDLGCARGDDVVWLATQGWNATGVDISATAVEYARQSAEQSGVSGRTTFVQLDLAADFLGGEFDLVAATFLQTPLDFPRIAVLTNAANAVRAGGMLLITAHQRIAPWSWGNPDAVLPDGRQRLAELNLNPNDWSEIFVGSIERVAKGPEGQSAPVTDAVVALERR